MIKFGIITDVNLSKGVARVHFDGDDLVSHWLPMGVPKSKVDKFSLPYDINEHVACMMDEHCEEGVILCAIYDAQNAPAITGRKVGVKLAPDLTIQYDRATKALSITGDGKITIDVSGDVSIKCANSTVEATVSATVKAATLIKLEAPMVEATAILKAATLQITAGASIVGGATISGDITGSGTITGAQVMEGSIRLGTHKHLGVTTGGGTSGTPTA